MGVGGTAPPFLTPILHYGERFRRKAVLSPLSRRVLQHEAGAGFFFGLVFDLLLQRQRASTALCGVTFEQANFHP
jgi:hypothetical protein